MILQYFKKKENKYKKTADKIYIDILSKSKKILNNNYFNSMDYNSSFEIISIILIFNLKIFKDYGGTEYKKINDELVKNFIQDLDESMREIGIGDMSIGKYVKKYVKKFYYRIKKIDNLIDNYQKGQFVEYLSSIKSINVNNISFFADELMDLYEEIKQKTKII